MVFPFEWFVGAGGGGGGFEPEIEAEGGSEELVEDTAAVDRDLFMPLLSPSEPASPTRRSAGQSWRTLMMFCTTATASFVTLTDLSAAFVSWSAANRL